MASTSLLGNVRQHTSASSSVAHEVRAIDDCQWSRVFARFALQHEVRSARRGLTPLVSGGLVRQTSQRAARASWTT